MRPSILGFFTVGMTTLSMLSVSVECVISSINMRCLQMSVHEIYHFLDNIF